MNGRNCRKGSTIQPFWLGRQIQDRMSEQASALVMVKGSYTNRLKVRGFCVNITDLLQNSKVPGAWALTTIEQNTSNVEPPSEIDLLKDTTCQILRLNSTLRNQRSLALSCTHFTNAQTEGEWLDLLSSVLVGLPQIYIVIDVEAVSSLYKNAQQASSWPLAFLDVFEKASERGLKTVVKVVLISYGSADFPDIGGEDLQGLVIPVARALKIPLAARGGTFSKQRVIALRGRGSSRG